MHTERNTSAINNVRILNVLSNFPLFQIFCPEFKFIFIPLSENFVLTNLQNKTSVCDFQDCSNQTIGFVFKISSDRTGLVLVKYGEWDDVTNSSIKKPYFLTSKLWENEKPVGIYLLKVNNRNSRTVSETCSQLTTKTPEWRSLTSLWWLYC